MANEIKSLKTEVSNAISNTTIADSILSNFSKLVSQEQLKFPDNYNVGNQLKLAYLTIIQNPDLSSCTPASIGQALTEFALQGLEVDKKHVYFIKYGNQLKMFRSYFGDAAVAYRTGLVKDIKSMVIYQGDQFETDVVNDEEVVTLHKTTFLNRDNPIIGAYAVATLPDGSKRYCIMTKKEIDANWNKSRSQKRDVQREFPQEMAKRTAIRRLVKMIFNTSNTSDNYISATIASYNRTTEEEYNNSAIGIPERKTTVSNTILPDEDDTPIESVEVEEVNTNDTEEHLIDSAEESEAK